MDSTAHTFRETNCTAAAPLAVEDVAVIPEVRGKITNASPPRRKVNPWKSNEKSRIFPNPERHQLDKRLLLINMPCLVSH